MPKHKKFIKDLYRINGSYLGYVKFYKDPKNVKIEYQDGLCIEIEKPYNIKKRGQIIFFNTFVVVEQENIKKHMKILEGYVALLNKRKMYIFCEECKKYRDRVFYNREDHTFKCSNCHGHVSANNFGDNVFDRRWSNVRNYCKKSGGKIDRNGMCVWDDNIFIERPELIDLKIKCLLREKKFFDSINSRYRRMKRQ